MKGIKDLNSAALKTAEISSIQISSNARTATPRDGWKKNRFKLVFKVKMFLNVKISKKNFASKTHTLHSSYEVRNKKNRLGVKFELKGQTVYKVAEFF
jgi:hypothetical protein